jgi:hypothetical protein
MDREREALMQQLVGTWRLVSSEFRTSAGAVIHPLGEDAQGLCLISAEGYLAGQLMRRDRPAFAGGDQASGTPEEVRAAMEGYVAYYGPFELDPEGRRLVTRVEGSLFPNWLGSEQERFYRFEGDRMTLTTPPMALGDEEFHGVLVWERLQSPLGG